MKPQHRHLRILGYHFYMSREKLRIVPVSNRRGTGLVRRLKELRNRRYKKRNGCCEACGQHYEKHEFQMHHILPYAVFPSLTAKKWNLLMLCKRCHYLIHHNIVWQIELMEHTARQHNINLEQEFNHAAIARWTDKQLKGATL